MSQNDQVPAGTENYPVNNYIPKSNPNSRPKKFTKYAYVCLLYTSDAADD